MSVKRVIRKTTSFFLVSCFVFVIMLTATATKAIAAEAASESFIATDNINLRAEASLSADILDASEAGAVVDVLEHDPAGWSKVKFNSTPGFMKSEFLALPARSLPKAFVTTDEVNFREYPSLEATVLRSIVTGSRVEVLEHDPAGWSKASYGGTVGYIRSDFLKLPIQSAAQTSTYSSDGAPVELWTSSGTDVNVASLKADVARIRSWDDKEIAKAMTVTIQIPVWKINADGEKYSSSAYINVHRELAGQVLQIFQEIYDDSSHFAIQQVGAWRWGNQDFYSNGAVRHRNHPAGAAIDINWTWNYSVYSNGAIEAGELYDPANYQYSMPANGIVVQTFKKYGWDWGGDWNYKKDYMHFSYLGG